MKTIIMHDGQFNEPEFYLFSQWEFDPDEGDHVGFILENSDGVQAIAYAWNLDSIEQAATATMVEIALIEVHASLRGKGLGTQLMQELEAQYTVAVYGVENAGFFSKLGYSLSKQQSRVSGDRLWTK